MSIHAMPRPKWRQVWQQSKPKRGDMGQAIKAHRERIGLSQQALAVAIGVSVGQVSRWERDIDNPTAKNIKALVLVLDCEYQELLK